MFPKNYVIKRAIKILEIPLLQKNLFFNWGEILHRVLNYKQTLMFSNSKE